MSSLEEMLAQASTNMAGATAALENLNGRIDAVEQAGINAVEALAASMSRAFFVDPENGDDSGDGRYGAPLKTLAAVSSRMPVSSRAYVYLMDDLTFSADVPVHCHMIILPAEGVTMPKIIGGPPIEYQGGNYVRAHGFNMRAGGSLHFRDVRICLSQNDPSMTGTRSSFAALIKQHTAQEGVGHALNFVNCEFEPGVPLAALCSLPISLMRVRAPVEIGSMLGHWSRFASDPAGTDPATVREVITDLTLI